MLEDEESLADDDEDLYDDDDDAESGDWYQDYDRRRPKVKKIFELCFTVLSQKGIQCKQTAFPKR